MYSLLSNYHSFYSHQEDNKEYFHSNIIQTDNGIILQSLHNAGFFSCCTTKLDDIIEYFNKYKKLPDIIDSSLQFNWYKQNKNTDVTYDYFKNPLSTIHISYVHHINFVQNDQFMNYKELPLETILPFVNKYFSPNDTILEMKKSYIKKYNIVPDNTCTLFYRGNDKNTETNTCSYEDIIIHAKEIQLKNPSIRFMIQSDESEFILRMSNEFPNSFYCKDEIRHMNKQLSTVDILYKDTNYEFSKKYLAITLLMAESKYIICGSSGNCSLWIIFYRNHINNLYQFNNGKWIIS